MRKIWPFTFNLLIFAGVAFVLPFIVLYYQSLGFTGAQIGLLTGVTPLVTLFCAPLWTGFADARQRHRQIMSLAVLMAALIILAFSLLKAFVPLLLCAILWNAFLAPILPLADSATMFMLANKKAMYGRVRLGGTIGFGLAATIAGVLVQNYGLRLLFWGCAILWFLAWIVSQNLAYNSVQTSNSAGSWRILLTNRRWQLFLMIAFAGGLAVSVSNNYLFAFMKQLGASETTMGLSLTIGTLSEIPVFFFGNRLVQRFGSYGLLMLAMVITGVRLVFLGASGTPNLVLFVQFFGGLTFPAMWMAGVAYADENAPVGMGATAQGMFGAMVMGFGSAVGGFVGGPLLESMGGQGLYIVFGVVVLIIVAFVAFMQSRLPTEQKMPPVTI